MQLNEHKENKDTRIYLIETLLGKTHGITNHCEIWLEPSTSNALTFSTKSRLHPNQTEATTSKGHNLQLTDEATISQPV